MFSLMLVSPKHSQFQKNAQTEIPPNLFANLKSLFHAFLQRKISPVWSKDGRIGDGPRSQHRGLLSCLLKTIDARPGNTEVPWGFPAEKVPEQIWKGTEPVLIL